MTVVLRTLRIHVYHSFLRAKVYGLEILGLLVLEMNIIGLSKNAFILKGIPCSYAAFESLAFIEVSEVTEVIEVIEINSPGIYSIPFH